MSVSIAFPDDLTSQNALHGPNATWPLPPQRTRSVSHTEVSQSAHIGARPPKVDRRRSEFLAQSRGTHEWIESKKGGDETRSVIEEVEEEIGQSGLYRGSKRSIGEEELEAMEGIAEEVALEYEEQHQQSNVFVHETLPSFGAAAHLLKAEDDADIQGQLARGENYHPPLRQIPIWRTGAAPSRIGRYFASSAQPVASTEWRPEIPTRQGSLPSPAPQGILRRDRDFEHPQERLRGPTKWMRPLSDQLPAVPWSDTIGRHMFIPPYTSRGRPGPQPINSSQLNDIEEEIAEGPQEVSIDRPDTTVAVKAVDLTKSSDATEQVASAKTSPSIGEGSSYHSISPPIGSEEWLERHLVRSPSDEAVELTSEPRNRGSDVDQDAREGTPVISSTQGDSSSSANEQRATNLAPTLESAVPGSVAMETQRRTVLPTPLHYLIDDLSRPIPGPELASAADPLAKISALAEQKPTSEAGTAPPVSIIALEPLISSPKLRNTNVSPTIGSPSSSSDPVSASPPPVSESPTNDPPPVARSTTLETETPSPLSSVHHLPTPLVDTAIAHFVDTSGPIQVDEGEVRSEEDDEFQAQLSWSEAWIRSMTNSLDDPLKTIWEETETEAELRGGNDDGTGTRTGEEGEDRKSAEAAV
ncbi:hypothetical protein CI109_104253 [Kwoniella shandongensis]|uniref:Uncharacterized protein n=1 Tax=Kwoniella shandongensis TaxID=1734106 RepID=A0A5M6C101_9TREE|nr:uncharacterized protein CI109_002841 [Kwoniella shandongensis]KAA5528683.1 hypothetical protein CI109_002841 [Kwoniella shandongensis]